MQIEKHDHDIEFWTLVEYENARRKMEEAKTRCFWQFCCAMGDIAAVILSLAEKEAAGFRLSEGTRRDLRRIAESPDYNDLDYRLSVIDACVDDETDPAFLEAVRKDCPQSYEYYFLWKRLWNGWSKQYYE